MTTSLTTLPRTNTGNGPDGIDPGRARPEVRALYQRPLLHIRDLAAPLLVHAGRVEAGLPGTVALADIPATVRRWHQLGIRAVKVFASGTRDDRASAATRDGNQVNQAVRAVKAAQPDMVVITDVCCCSWTSTGHCALLDWQGRIDLAGTHRLMADMAAQHALSGADIVSPTAMLAGSVHAVRTAVTDLRLPDVGVCPTVAVRTALHRPATPDAELRPPGEPRQGLQLEPGHADRDAIIQADQWMTEGADSLTIQPALTTIDVLVRLRTHLPNHRLTACVTAGEYPVLQALTPTGMAEYHAALKRAGADLILTFAAEELARHLNTCDGPEES